MRIQKNKALLATLVIALAGAGLWYALKPAPAKLASPTAIPVRVVAVSEKDVPRYTSGIGSVLS
jgi:multidrug efflux pump subunit AcrA (membrane-fusion protein)